MNERKRQAMPVRSCWQNAAEKFSQSVKLRQQQAKSKNGSCSLRFHRALIPGWSSFSPFPNPLT